MKEIKATELTDNLFQTIGKEWMLVTAGTPEKFNTMTASWLKIVVHILSLL